MSLATAGYNAIPSRSAPEVSIPFDAPTSQPDAPASRHVEAVARTATAVAASAKEAVTELIRGENPDVKLYTEPLNPSALLTLNDRAQLVLESCRPWSEFADVNAFAMPVASEAKLRVGHNFEVFFYNYLIVAFAILALHAIFRPLSALLLATTVAAAVMLYIIYPEDYVVSDSFAVTKTVKHAFMTVITILILTVGNVFSLVFIVALTVSPIVVVHAFLRQHDAPSHI